MIEDKEFLQYIKDTGFFDLLDIDEKSIIRYKNTFHYQCWGLGKSKDEVLRSFWNEYLEREN